LLLTCRTVSADFNISDIPLFLNQAVNPRVMLTMSNDHQLYIKAYTDYSDLDSDGVLETSYTDTVDYAGYFDSGRCYVYSNNRFQPSDPATGTNDHSCSTSNNWSGNFLNWATMTRMDIIRKVLYGGYRLTDTVASTVLERVIIPFDAHAFTKVFNSNSSEQMREFTSYSNGQTEITLCNFTDASGLGRDVDTASSPPLLRVADGSWPHWASSEARQCDWDSGSNASKPQIAQAMSGTDFNVRVEVCATGKEESNCKTYTDGTNSNKKPVGILQRYGDARNGRPIQFGLMTGSYQKNKSGGVLRSNINPLTGNTTASLNEFNPDTGVFINQGATDAGIINTLNRLRISSYNFSQTGDVWGGTSHFYANNCGDPRVGSFADGDCVDWGNPLSEIYLESLRYYAGKSSPTAAFNADDSELIPSLPQVPWTDPQPTEQWCADNSIITISTGLNSYDTDQLSNDLGIAINTKTNEVGALEGINGSSYLIGSNGTNNNQQCTAKTLSGLADAVGVCPEVPSLQGGYDIAGLAYYAHTEDLRPDRDNVQTINTSSIALAESVPRFEIAMSSDSITILPACQSNTDGSAGANSTGWRTCSLLDVVVENLVYSGAQQDQLIEGSLLINWEDSTQGSDYDMDGTQRLKFCVGSACSPAVNSDQIKITTQLLQSAAGFALRYGFTVTGSDQDGMHFPLLNPGGSFVTLAEYEADNSRLPAAQDIVLTNSGSAAQVLNNPLWYAAKYGGFIESDDPDDPKPNLTSEWDADSDGVPDNYFQVTNPAKLDDALANVLDKVIERTASASSVATNATRLDTNTLVYQARFDSGNWSGDVLAYPINPDGSIATSTWDAGNLIPTENSRHIYTYDSTSASGVEFEWSELNAAQTTALENEEMVDYLRGDKTNEQQNNGSFRNRSRLLGDIVNSDPWFVGHENFGYDNLPDQADPGSEGPAYRTFIHSTAFKDRRSMLYVGSNDGMLHGFDATTGVEQFAYVPNFLISNLPQLASPNYVHRYYVDGSPRAAAANFGTTTNAQWKTVLVGSAGAGGRGIFALDVTNPDTFTASNVLWEFDSSDDSDLGYSIGQPTIVRMANGQWVAIIANGYNSDSHKAVLFILNIRDGSVIAKLDTEAGDASTPNGLSTVIPVDSDNDYTVDTIYAGDMLGNLWKFDVSDNLSNRWDIAFKHGQKPEPLFKACNEDPCVNSQPITAKPQVGRHPDGGVMVYFGTGQYFETGDNVVSTTPQVHTYYGLRDNGAQIDSRDDLQQQTILTEVSFQGRNYRVTSNTTVDYSNKQGWYLDLVPPSPASAAGERVVTPSLLRHGRIIFTTLLPSPDVCLYGGTSWLMEIDAVNGASLAKTPIDINGDQKINKDDVLYTTDSNGDGNTDSDDDGVSVSGVQTTIGIIKTPGVISAGDKEFKYTSGSSGNLEVIAESNDGLHGRLSWRELR
jgi:type IV pilus assembly protein PilY1